MCICVSDTVYMNDVHVYTSDVYVWYCMYEWHICVHICLYVRICVRICLYVRRMCICVSVILYIWMTHMSIRQRAHIHQCRHCGCVGGVRPFIVYIYGIHIYRYPSPFHPSTPPSIGNHINHYPPPPILHGSIPWKTEEQVLLHECDMSHSYTTWMWYDAFTCADGTPCNTLHHAATHCKHDATHCKTLQHTATGFGRAQQGRFRAQRAASNRQSVRGRVAGIQTQTHTKTHTTHTHLTHTHTHIDTHTYERLPTANQNEGEWLVYTLKHTQTHTNTHKHTQTHTLSLSHTHVQAASNCQLVRGQVAGIHTQTHTDTPVMSHSWSMWMSHVIFMFYMNESCHMFITYVNESCERVMHQLCLYIWMMYMSIRQTYVYMAVYSDV